MSYKTVVLNPSGDSGYAIFLEKPDDGSSIVNVMTKNYIRDYLPLGNYLLSAEQSTDSNGNPTLKYSYTPPTADELKDPTPKLLESLVKYAHDSLVKKGYKDRTPHAVELVDSLFDRNMKESDASKAMIEIRKHHNIHGSTILIPPYPEQMSFPVGPKQQAGGLPQLPLFMPPLPFIPLPSSPF